MKKALAFLLAIALVSGAAYYTLQPSAFNEELLDAVMSPAQASDFYDTANRLEVSTGVVTVVRADGEEVQVQDETTVTAGDTIQVPAEAAATLFWFDDSLSRLKGGTTLTIREADYNPEVISETTIDVELIKGEVWSNVVDLVDEDSSFLVRNGTIVAGVRGTINNIIALDEEFIVESIEHTTFVAELDLQTEEIVEQELVSSGDTVEMPVVEQSPRFAERRRARMNAERMESGWMSDNLQQDARDRQRLRDRSLERLKARLGPLPGEEGYEEKQELMKERLEKADAAERSVLQARIAEVQLMEKTVLVRSGGGSLEASDIATQMAVVSDVQLKMMNRTMQDVLPNEAELYAVKQEIRDERLRRTATDEDRAALEQKFAEREVYELSDALKSGDLSDERMRQQLDKLQSLMGDGVMPSDDPLRQIIADQMGDHIAQLSLSDQPALRELIEARLQERYGDDPVLLREKKLQLLQKLAQEDPSFEEALQRMLDESGDQEEGSSEETVDEVVNEEKDIETDAEVESETDVTLSDDEVTEETAKDEAVAVETEAIPEDSNQLEKPQLTDAQREEVLALKARIEVLMNEGTLTKESPVFIQFKQTVQQLIDEGLVQVDYFGETRFKQRVDAYFVEQASAESSTVADAEVSVQPVPVSLTDAEIPAAFSTLVAKRLPAEEVQPFMSFFQSKYTGSLYLSKMREYVEDDGFRRIVEALFRKSLEP